MFAVGCEGARVAQETRSAAAQVGYGSCIRVARTSLVNFDYVRRRTKLELGEKFLGPL